MSTSATDISRARIKRLGWRFLWISLACAVFSFVYECFSHQVYAHSMIFAFLYPMIGGTLPCFVISRLRRLPKPWTLYAWRAGVMTAMIGSLMRGALEIYGTTNRLTAAYPMLCGALCLAGAIGYLIAPQKMT